MISLSSRCQKIFWKIAASLFIAGGGIALHAQTSPLDTAPGAPTASLTNQASATPAPAVAAPLPADLGPSLLSNSNFDLATKDPTWPDDWGKGAGISWETENGIHFLRLVQQTPGKMLMAYREMRIPDGTKGIKITIHYRTQGIVHGKQNWMDARAIFHYLDGARRPVKGDPGAIRFSNSGAWAVGTCSSVVPEGAVTLQMMPSIFMANAGTLDLAEVRVDPVDDAMVASMSATSAAKDKQAADRAALIATLLARPPKTPELKVAGNQLVTADGKSVWLQGVNVPELSWSPNGEGSVPWSIHVAVDEWHANVVRLPVMDSLWFGKGRGEESSNDPNAYRAIVDDAVKMAAGSGAYLVLDLHRFMTPDQSCIDFWKDAATRYKDNPAVLFDIFNEPHGTTWDVWQKGGPVEVKQKDGTSQTTQGVGMQALIDAVRGTGAHNVIAAGGLGYAYDLTGVVDGHALDDKGGNGIMYSTHFYNWHKGWAEHFMAVAAKYPVLVGETGADIHKMGFIPLNDQEDPYTWAPDAIGFIQMNHLNWTAWSFHTSATPDMLLNKEDYTPTPFWGQFVKDALGGKQFEMKKER